MNAALLDEDRSVPTADKDWAHLPKMISAGGELGPAAPMNPADLDVDPSVVADLALKLALTVPHLTTDWAARRLCLPMPLIEQLLDQMKKDQLLEVLGQVGPFNRRYAISKPGRERAARLVEISGYVGPAPVSLDAYKAMIEWQVAHTPKVHPEQVAAAVSDLVLPKEAVLVAGLALSSVRSFFIWGPSGNGKTSLGRLLHNAFVGDIWIPHCLGIESTIIRIFDPYWHERSQPETEVPRTIDQRWVKIKRPMVIVGGELTMDALDLIYSPVLRYFEAPLHMKANGGTFMIDDFGRERFDPDELLNRWIGPLEHQVDYLTLQTGQKIEVPFRLMLILATNLDPDQVMDPAFLRRMGYRLQIDTPTPEQYRQIFERYGARYNLVAPSSLLDHLMERYQSEKRELRACEPRDLIERIRDICRFRSEPLVLNEDLLDLAWIGYFGKKAPI